MEWWQVISVVLGSSVLVSITNLIAERLKRKDSVEDRKVEIVSQIEKLRSDTTEQNEVLDKRIVTVEKKVESVSTKIDAVALSSKAQAYDRIRYLGLTYIRKGWISVEELENFCSMHDAYKALGGDGFLDKLRDNVTQLRIVADYPPQ